MFSVLKDPFIDENEKNPISCRQKMSFQVPILKKIKRQFLLNIDQLGDIEALGMENAAN
jgi:hypothetical protein